MSNEENELSTIKTKKGIWERLKSDAFKTAWRPLVAYWILGLCNNYGYVVMLTAANDILSEDEVNSNLTDNPDRECNYMSTGAILLADILPSLAIKIIAPFLPFFVNVRVTLCILAGISGFLIVAFSSSHFLSIIGVVVTSLASGLGEITFLQYSTKFSKNVISTWSSGTGGAGVFGAFSYVVLNILGTQTALLIMTVMPILMGLSFWIILPKPNNSDSEKEIVISSSKLSFKEKLVIIPKLLKYMIPVGLVYFLEYFINQGMFELIYFKDTFLDKSSQYRWLQVDYQLGVFISRSSVNIFHLRKIWLMAIFQAINVVYFTTEVIYYFTPYFWIVLIITLWEGLLGGAAYVNTFYRISKEVPENERHFSMGITTFADSIGIALAGVVAIIVHNPICSLPKPTRLVTS